MGGLRLRLAMSRFRSSACARFTPPSDHPQATDVEEERVDNGGSAERFCLSPVNPKSVEIGYPAGSGKRHLAKATVVSPTGCGCRALARAGRRRKNKTGAETEAKEEKQEKTVRKEDSFRWEEEEDGWHVVAKVNDEIVRKKVVLYPPASPAPSPEGVSVRSCFARTNSTKKAAAARRKPAQKKKKKKNTVAKGDCSSSKFMECCNYRLSTSSADTAAVESSSLSFSWEKDYGSPASDEDEETLFSASDYKSFSSESSFEFYESRSPHLSTIHENSPPRNSRRLKARHGRRSSSAAKGLERSPADLSVDEGAENAQSLPLLSSPDFATGSRVVCSPSAEDDKDDLEAIAKKWRDAGFPLRRDDIRTVIHRSSELSSSPNCLSFAMVSCGRDADVRKPNIRSKSSLSANSYSRLSDSKKSVKRSSPRRKSNKSSTNTSCVRTPPVASRVQGKVSESVAVVKSSQDPYQDFKTSMLEMIVEKQIFQASDLEQLLQCFLSLNSKQHHEIIVQVFTEIWGNIFASGTRNPSTPVAFFQSIDA